MQEINQDIDPVGQNVVHQANDMEIADEEEGMDIDVVENWVPQHPDQPQDTITFNQSGSTANYLRANTGPTFISLSRRFWQEYRIVVALPHLMIKVWFLLVVWQACPFHPSFSRPFRRSQIPICGQLCVNRL